MKNMYKIGIPALMLVMSSGVKGQVQVNNGTTSGITNSNVMLDGSTAFSTEAGAGVNQGKGIVVPSVDLVNFEFDLSLADGVTFPTYFDGMVVYNNATGTTLITGNRSSTATSVVPGFYYYYNPNGATNGNITGGIWKPIGTDPRFNIAAAEVMTNTLLNGTQVYAKKGTFTTNGTSTSPTAYSPAPIAIPSTGTAGIYRVVIFKAGTNTVYANSVYSYDITTGNFITGSPGISVVYPAGTYDYVVEYTK